jgi:hypothetical protein
VVNDNEVAGLYGFKQAIDAKKLVWTGARPWYGTYDKTVARAVKYISRGYDGDAVLRQLAQYPETQVVFEVLRYMSEMTNRQAMNKMRDTLDALEPQSEY